MLILTFIPKKKVGTCLQQDLRSIIYRAENGDAVNMNNNIKHVCIYRYIVLWSIKHL